MYQTIINKCLGIKLYDIPKNTKYIGRFVCTDRNNNNKYVQYAKGLIDMATTKARLQAICYNSHSDYSSWNVRPRSLRIYAKTGEQVISNKLCEKILRSVNNDFMKCVENLLLDYHIILKDGVPIKFKDYPLIYKAIGYIETFPITYFDEDFTRTELKQLTKYMKGQMIVIVLKDVRQIKIIRNITMGSYETIVTDLSMSSLITVPLYFNNKPLAKIKQWCDMIYSNQTVVSKLLDCL